MSTTIDRIGKYELKARLARTPTSIVYDAWDSVIARRVALKLMPLSPVEEGDAAEALARFKRGAQAAGQLNHPNIVAVYDYGETEDYAYLVMEFVSGSTLKDLFDARQRFALPDTCRIIGSVLEALQYSHGRGVVHRDIKPANIMLTAENQVKITDFGIARLEDSQITQAGMVIGTPAYMSPEQFLGENTDFRTDIYSTGVVLYQALTGERPYEGNLATIMHKVLYGELLSPSRASTQVTPALDAVVRKAMARNREDRFNSAAEFRAAVLAGRAPTSSFSPGSARERASHPARRDDPTRSGSFIPKLLLGMLTAAAIAAGGWYGYVHLAPQLTAIHSVHLKQVQSAQEQARLQQARDQMQQEIARRQQQQQATLEQERAEREQTLIQLQQQEARDQQAAQQQEQERIAREQQEQAEAKQQQAEAEQQQAEAEQQQEQAREREQARQHEMARQKQARQEQEARKQVQDQARRKAQEQARQKLAMEQIKQAQQSAPQDQKQLDQADNSGVPSYPVTSSNGAIGLVCRSVTAETARSYGLDNPQGMAVTGVTAGLPADRAGIRQDDVILRINGVQVHDLSALSNRASGGSVVPVELLRRGGKHVVQLSLGTHRD